MSVRAKFYVTSIAKTKFSQVGGQVGTVIKLNPVMDGSEENKQFYQYSPAGSIELGTINEEAAKSFDIGDEFYVDFTKAE